jgi:hypothetical protein
VLYEAEHEVHSHDPPQLADVRDTLHARNDAQHSISVVQQRVDYGPEQIEFPVFPDRLSMWPDTLHFRLNEDLQDSERKRITKKHSPNRREVRNKCDHGNTTQQRVEE